MNQDTCKLCGAVSHGERFATVDGVAVCPACCDMRTQVTKRHAPPQTGDRVRIEHPSMFKIVGILRAVGEFIDIDVAAPGGTFHRVRLDRAMGASMERA